MFYQICFWIGASILPLVLLSGRILRRGGAPAPRKTVHYTIR